MAEPFAIKDKANTIKGKIERAIDLKTDITPGELAGTSKDVMDMIADLAENINELSERLTLLEDELSKEKPKMLKSAAKLSKKK